MVDDDDGDESPSPEPQTGSRSALPMKNRRWRWLHIVKRDGTSSPIFSREIGIYSAEIRVSGAMWAPQATRAHPGASWAPGGPPPVGLCSSIFYLFRKKSPKNFVQFRELLFLHKNNTMVVLLKTASVRVSFIQIMQIRVQNKS